MTPERIDEIERWIIFGDERNKAYSQWPTEEEKRELCALARRTEKAERERDEAVRLLQQWLNAAPMPKDTSASMYELMEQTSAAINAAREKVE